MKTWTKVVLALVGGGCLDGWLRFRTGEEGNLLVHMVVFLLGAAVCWAGAELLARIHHD